METDSTQAVADSIGSVLKLSADNTNYSINIFGVVVRAILSLLGIVILIFLTILVLKKVAFQQRTPAHFMNKVSVLGTVPISPKKTIQLLKLVDRVLVIAVTESTVSLLTEIDETDVLNELEPADEDRTHTQAPFKQYLNKMLGNSDES